jgi:hypothetical protein
MGNLIGGHMIVFVNIVNMIIGKQCLICAEWTGRTINKSKFIGKNTVAPRGSTNDDVHWIFIDQQGKEYNSYTLHMQRNSSHQFCQSHALKMGYFYCTDKPVLPSTPCKAYQELLDFWQMISDSISKDIRLTNEIDGIISAVFAEVLEFNKKNENPGLLSQATKSFPTNFKGILNVLKSEYALDVCPQWM